jgi:MFS family permease
LFSAFLYLQKKRKDPLLPLNIFKVRNLLVSNLVMALLGAAWIPMWFFLNLYLQQVLGYGAFESGLALLPMTISIMFLMIFVTPKMVNLLGIRKNMIIGMVLLSIGILSFAMTPSSDSNQNTSFFIYVLPASLVAAVGMSLAYIPVLTAAVSNIQPKQAGLGSGLVNTSYQIGSALGLAILVAWSTAQSGILVDSGIPHIEALNNGFHLSFIGAAIVAITAITLVIFKIKNKSESDKEISN